MSAFDEVFDRIKLATNTKTQVELAEVLGIRQSSISDAKRRNSVPADWYMKLFEKFGLNPDWLKKEAGPVYLRTEQGYQPTNVGSGSGYLLESPGLYGAPEAKSTVVTVYSMHGANMTEAPGEPDVIGKLSIPQSFFAPGIQVFKVDTAGMEPLVCKGAYIGIDTNQKNVVSGEIFAVHIPFEGISLKRVFLDGDNQRLVLKAENQKHPDQYISLDKHKDRIVGNLTWVMQEF
ncbi:MAG: helix-turn-helix domain-containing protein [Desulfovibrionaceae bacterium]|nr:helix-turn-helix domain-containing protein [Desulfovibrionaceae bacterium]